MCRKKMKKAKSTRTSPPWRNGRQQSDQLGGSAATNELQQRPRAHSTAGFSGAFRLHLREGLFGTSCCHAGTRTRAASTQAQASNTPAARDQCLLHSPQRPQHLATRKKGHALQTCSLGRRRHPLEMTAPRNHPPGRSTRGGVVPFLSSRGVLFTPGLKRALFSYANQLAVRRRQVKRRHD